MAGRDSTDKGRLPLQTISCGDKSVDKNGFGGLKCREKVYIFKLFLSKKCHFTPHNLCILFFFPLSFQVSLAWAVRLSLMPVFRRHGLSLARR